MSDQDKFLDNLDEVAAHLQNGEKPAPVETEKPKGNKRFVHLGWVGMMLAFALGKMKFLFMGLKLMKFSSILTMLVSIWAYSLFFGWPFAVGFVLLILVHEYGHLLAMRWLGIPAGAPTFIPFVGAVIVMKGRPRNAFIEALVAFGGPVLGSVAALVCLLISFALDSDFWQALAYTGFWINFFNMLPISPLDGGRIVGAFSRKMWIVGFLIGIPAFWYSRSPMLFLILLVGLLGLIGRHKEREGYYDIPQETKVKIAVAYFTLAAVLASAMALTHLTLE
jgi:Zn-dependent protease